MAPPNGQIKTAELSARQHRIEARLESCRFENGQKLDRIEQKVDALAAELARFMTTVAEIAEGERVSRVAGDRSWLQRILERLA